jgi:hypothetical protein
MPEIWLRYGVTDVVLDIKFDNLSSQVSSNFPTMPDDQLRAQIESIQLTDNMLVLALSPSKAVSKVVLMIAELARAKGFGVTVDVPAKMAATLRASLTAMPGGEAVPINRAEYQSILERLSKFQSSVIVSAVSYDPLFGYAGVPTTLLRNFMPEKMSEAYGARRDNLPAPGEELGPLKIALSAMEGLGTTSIELVANGSGIAGVHTGTIAEAFGNAVAQLRSISVVEEEPAKCAIMSASAEPGVQTTLTSSLGSLWNNIHIVKEGGTAILLAECRDGIGGGALQMMVEGRLGAEQLTQRPYIEGLEHLLFAAELRQKYELGLVSTLPKYYASSKLGYIAYSGMNDILQKLPEKIGKSYRAIVLSDADIIMLKPKI